MLRPRGSADRPSPRHHVSRVIPTSQAQQRQGNHGDPVVAPVSRRAGGDDDEIPDLVAELVTQPEQVAHVLA